MSHLPVSAPSFAVFLGAVLMISGAAWWAVAAALLLGAPFFVGFCYAVCTLVLPCDPKARDLRRAAPDQQPGISSRSGGSPQARS